jgi:type I restriction enzyme, R subunit
MLRKLLTNEIKTRSRRNVVKSRLFSELLEGSIRKYQNRAIQAAQVIEELIGLAKQMREETAKGEALSLSEDEVAFYDALEVNDSAVKVLGDETLKTIARERQNRYHRRYSEEKLGTDRGTTVEQNTAEQGRKPHNNG